MAPTPCPYATRWPELFARLPDDVARESLSQALANARLEGWEPTRDAVELLVDAAVGTIGEDQLVAAVLAHADRTVTARRSSAG